MVPSNQIYPIVTSSELENVWKFKQAFSFQSGLSTVGKVGFNFPSQIGFCSHILTRNVEFSAIKLVTLSS